MSRSEIYVQMQFGWCGHYQTKHNIRDAFRVASARTASTGKRHKFLDEDGCLLDLIDPLGEAMHPIERKRLKIGIEAAVSHAKQQLKGLKGKNREALRKEFEE